MKKIIKIVIFLLLLSIQYEVSADIVRYSEYKDGWTLSEQYFDFGSRSDSYSAYVSATNSVRISSGSSVGSCISGPGDNFSVEYGTNLSGLGKIEIYNNLWRFRPGKDFEFLPTNSEIVFCYDIGSISTTSKKIRIKKAEMPLVIRSIGSSNDKRIFLSKKIGEYGNSTEISLRCEEEKLFSNYDTGENEEKVTLSFKKFDFITNNDNFQLKIEANNNIINTRDTQILTNGDIVNMNFYFSETGSVVSNSGSNFDSELRYKYAKDFIQANPEKLEMSLYNTKIDNIDNVYNYSSYLFARSNGLSLSTSTNIPNGNGQYFTLMTHIRGSIAKPSLKVFYVKNYENFKISLISTVGSGSIVDGNRTSGVTTVSGNAFISNVNINDIIPFDGIVEINGVKEKLSTSNFKYISSNPEIANIGQGTGGAQGVLKILKSGVALIRGVYVDSRGIEYLSSNSIKIQIANEIFNVSISAIVPDYSIVNGNIASGNTIVTGNSVISSIYIDDVIPFDGEVEINGIKERLSISNFRYISSNPDVANIGQGTGGAQGMLRILKSGITLVRGVYIDSRGSEYLSTNSIKIQIANEYFNVSINATVGSGTYVDGVYSLGTTTTWGNSFISNVNIDDTIPFNGSVDLNGVSKRISTSNFKYISSNPEIASISQGSGSAQGMLRILKGGITLIRGFYTDSNGSEYASNNYIKVQSLPNGLELNLKNSDGGSISGNTITINIDDILQLKGVVKINNVEQLLTLSNFNFESSNKDIALVDSKGQFGNIKGLKIGTTTIQGFYISGSGTSYATNPITVRVADRGINFKVSADRRRMYVGEVVVISGSLQISGTSVFLDPKKVSLSVSNVDILDISNREGDSNVAITAKKIGSAVVSASYTYNDGYKITSPVLSFEVVPRPVSVVSNDAIPGIVAPGSLIEFKTVLNTYRVEGGVAYVEIVFNDDRFRDLRSFRDTSQDSGSGAEQTFVGVYQIPNDITLNGLIIPYEATAVQNDGTRTLAGASEIYIGNKEDICKHPTLCAIRGLQALDLGIENRNDFYRKVIGLFTDTPETFSKNDIYKKYREQKSLNK